MKVTCGDSSLFYNRCVLVGKKIICLFHQQDHSLLGCCCHSTEGSAKKMLFNWSKVEASKIKVLDGDPEVDFFSGHHLGVSGLLAEALIDARESSAAVLVTRGPR